LRRVAVLAGIGSTIMGVALMIGMLVTPYAEAAFGQLAQRFRRSSRVSHTIKGWWGIRWEVLFDNHHLIANHLM